MPYPKHVCELKTQEDKDEMKHASWRRRLRNRIQSWSLISPKNFRSYLFLRTQGTIQKEMQKQKSSKYWYIVHPFSLLRLYWEIFMLCVYFVFALFIFFRTSFLNSFMATYHSAHGKPLGGAVYIASWIELAFCAVCFIDMFGFFITGYYDPEEEVTVMNPRKIQKRYLYRDFILDLSSSMPSDSLVVFFRGLKAYTSVNYPTFVFLELYNEYRLIRFRRAIPYFWQCSKLSMFSRLFFRLVFIVLIYLLLIHWMMTLSIIIPEIFVYKGLYESKVTVSWLQDTRFFDMVLQEQYMSTLMRTLQNNIESNDTAEGLHSGGDYLIALLSSLVGRIYFLFFLLIMLEAVTASNALNVRFRRILNQLKSYMKQKDMPVALKKRLSRFYLYRFEDHYFSHRAMLGNLAESLRKEICLCTYQRLLGYTEVFQSVPKKVLTNFVQRMNKEMYFPKDVIIQGNTFGDCMYFISSGTVAIETLSDKEICTLGEGNFFGEIALIMPDRRRIATVKAVTITEVFRLEHSDFKSITAVYPDVYSVLKKNALERFKTTSLVEKATRM